MSTPLLTLGLSIVLVGQVPEPELGRVPEPVESIARKLSGSIQRAGYRRVGVIPRFLQREGGVDTWDGSMGPHGEWLSEVFARSLEDQGRGRFQIVKNLEVARALNALKLSPAGLDDREAMKPLARRAGGLDALIVGRAVDVREPAGPGSTAGKLVGSVITCNLFDLKTGELTASAYRELPITPSLAAFRGEPAGSGAYIPLGIDLADPAGKGVNAPNLPPRPRDVARAEGTRESGSAPSPVGPQGVEVPALDDPRCPFPVRVIVDGEERHFYRVIHPRTGRRDLFVNLEPGETYQIAVKNKTDATVYGVVYVDGINILGVRRDPDDPRYWNIARGQDCRFCGWYVKEKDGYKEIPLIVRPASDSIAAQLGGGKEGLADRVGEIQCLFFGTDGEPRSEAGAKSMMLNRIGTGGGEAREIKIGEVMGPKRSENRLLSFVIHYASMSQIEKLRVEKD